MDFDIKDVVEPGPNSKTTDKSEDTYDTPSTTLNQGSSSIQTLEPSTSTGVRSITNNKVKLYVEDTGPKWYTVKGDIVTPSIISKNLPELFNFMPVDGMLKTKSQLEEFQQSKVREYVGCDIGDEEFEKLANFCSPNNLKVGTELEMSTSYPTQGPLPDEQQTVDESDPSNNLCIVKKLKIRLKKDVSNHYTRKLKYRGVRIIPPSQDEDFKIPISPYQPGKDLVFRIRVYRPFYSYGKDRNCTRHSVFSNDILMLGRHKLTMLRDRIVCANDIGMRLDVSKNPEDLPTTSAKELFPSGFLFINNVFYVDTRKGCVDHSQPIREWAITRGLGDFPHKDMSEVTLDQIAVKLGHPEVYVHQGRCEHPFTFSSLRLLNVTDASFPTHSAVANNQTVYCATCAEFGAKWIVSGCSMVPFDPAFFCDTCLKLYLYVDGKKMCDFKAYSYRGNEINVLKPTN